jgi:uncharacterized protein (DUF58 family)
MTLAARLAQRYLAQRFTRRFADWSARREGRGRAQIVLDRRRTYVLPTRAGIVFGALLAALLIASINYALQLGFLLTFFVAGMALVALFHTHRNLAALRLRAQGAARVFAGDVATFSIHATNPDPRDRMALRFRLLADDVHDALPPVDADVPAASGRVIELWQITTRRGRLACPRIRVETSFPLGLWRAWGYFSPPLSAIVYPAPEAGAPPLPAAREGDGDYPAAAALGDDFAGVRPYQQGDPQRLIAWRLAARSDELSIKLFDGAGGELMLAADAIALPLEAQLARLARWILMADARHLRYGLRLPAATIAPGSGAEHRERCLTALALA